MKQDTMRKNLSTTVSANILLSQGSSFSIQRAEGRQGTLQVPGHYFPSKSHKI